MYRFPSINQFRNVVQHVREQALHNLINEQLKPFTMSSMGDFIRWVHQDVLKEEADTLQASGIDYKKLGSPIALAARRWFITKLDEETFK